MAISISAFCYVRLPSCHPERRAKPAAEPARAMRSIGIYEGERMLFSPEILLGYASHCFAVRLRNRFAVLLRSG